MTKEEYLALTSLKEHCVSDSKFRVQHMRDLVDILPNIKQIRGLDSEKRGTVVLEEEAIAHLRIKIPLVCKETDIEDIMGEVGRNVTWKALTVKSEEVVLNLTRRNDVSDETMTENCFEETEYCELAMELTKIKYCYSTLSCRRKFFFLLIFSLITNCF